MNSPERAKEIIEKIAYATLATASRNGQPWNSPVYTAFDEKFNFFWASWRENQHSKHIAENPNVFIVIYDSTVPQGTGEGVYIQAKAYALESLEEIAHAMKYHYGRKNKEPRKAEEFLGNYPRRMYKAVPENIWMNSDDRIDGNWIDTREEIKLL